MSQGISVGKYHAGILSNCEDCQKATFDAGRTCGDLTFPLPYCPELHFSEFNSSVADMKNSVAVSISAVILNIVGIEEPNVVCPQRIFL